ncbi:MAG: LysM peptidoglycan-binding domain-containing protein, partial [Ferruginibacter sp.]|nr:LysM peptidoglycan-binding domain-containing protein [Cytophagales bacterium]
IRQASRRVEFTLRGTPPSYQSATRTYLLRQSVTLFDVARAFGMTVAELQGLNGLRFTRVRANHPIRVRNTGQSNPYPWLVDPEG